MSRSKQPSCAHCRNLGLKDSHKLRESADPESTLLCPVLLNTECKYCHTLGHNVSKCKALLAKKSGEKQNQIVVSIPIREIQQNQTVYVEFPNKKTYSEMAGKLLAMIRPSGVHAKENQGIVHRYVLPEYMISRSRRYIAPSKPWADDEAWDSDDER